jgi:signal transduction histidine kinase
MFGLTGERQPYRFGPSLVVALALWIPLAGLTGYAAVQARDALRAADEHRLQDVANAIAISADAKLGATVASLGILAGSELLQPLDPPGFEAKATLAARLLGGEILLVGPTAADGVRVSTSPDPALLAQRVAAGWIADAMAPLLRRLDEAAGAGLSDLFIGPVQQRTIFALGVPVPGSAPGGHRLLLTLEPVALQALMQDLGLASGTVATIRDGRFRPVAGSARQQAGADESALRWMAEHLGERREAVLAGQDAEGQDILVAVRRLDTDPRWMVTVSERLADQQTAMLAAMTLPGLGIALTLLGVFAVAWAAKRERLHHALLETQTLRSARDHAARIHAGLPAVIFVREMTARGEPGRLLFRAGDINGVTGWPATAMQDVFMGDLSDSVSEMRAAMERFMREGEMVFDWRMRQPDGGWRWLRCKARTLDLLADGGRVAVGYITNVSAEREAQAQAQAARRLASLADMAHGLAHELKQPLQVIALSAETAQVQIGRMAASDSLPAPMRDAANRVEESLEGIVQQALRTGEVIEHLRRFARGSAGTTPVAPLSLDLAVEGAMLLVGHGLRRDGVVVEVALGDPAPVVLGQIISIEQILINLLNNARDAMADLPEGAPRRIRIAATAAADAGMVALTVADTAGGIPPEVLERLFEPFVTTKGVDKGTGLGLSICHGLARGMGATIEARNDDEGAVFTLRMPLAAPSAPRDAAVDAA